MYTFAEKFDAWQKFRKEITTTICKHYSCVLLKLRLKRGIFCVCRRFVDANTRRIHENIHKNIGSTILLAIFIRSSEKFLSFYGEIMDARHFSFHIILSNYV